MSLRLVETETLDKVKHLYHLDNMGNLINRHNKKMKLLTDYEGNNFAYLRLNKNDDPIRYEISNIFLKMVKNN
jgi:hypothetical protein